MYDKYIYIYISYVYTHIYIYIYIYIFSYIYIYVRYIDMIRYVLILNVFIKRAKFEDQNPPFPNNRQSSTIHGGSAPKGPALAQFLSAFQVEGA